MKSVFRFSKVIKLVLVLYDSLKSIILSTSAGGPFDTC